MKAAKSGIAPRAKHAPDYAGLVIVINVHSRCAAKLRLGFTDVARTFPVVKHLSKLCRLDAVLFSEI